MIHVAARGEPYACFVRRDTRIPFMGMPDAIDALLQLAAAPRRLADHHAVPGPGHDGREQEAPLGIRDRLGDAAVHPGDQAVGGAEINADAHISHSQA
jgi:hypothetical protein